MLQQAERFTRKTVLPFVSNLTPRFITDIFAPRPISRFIPFVNEDVSQPEVKLPENNRNKRNQRFNPPPKVNVPVHESTTVYSHIQKVPKKKSTPK